MHSFDWQSSIQQSFSAYQIKMQYKNDWKAVKHSNKFEAEVDRVLPLLWVHEFLMIKRGLKN